MTTSTIQITVKGTPRWVPSAEVAGRTVIVTGKAIKRAAVMDEELVEGETVADPDAFMGRLRATGLAADILTFAQKVPDAIPRHPYRHEWDSAAVIPITTYADWWDRRAQYDVRKAVKRAGRLGVVVKPAEFDDALVEGICAIYDESPVRQGQAFWHYRKGFEDVKRESATYLERSTFIGAYCEDQLIGFIKMVRVGRVETTLHVISQKRHFDKKPTNALIAKAVELCAQSGASHLVYGAYEADGAASSLTEFKRRNGFEQVRVPRYYVPLTLKGRLALRWNAHHPLAAHLSPRALARLRSLRRRWYATAAPSSADAT